jgi:trk system potassium uptake protein TrkH
MNFKGVLFLLGRLLLALACALLVPAVLAYAQGDLTYRDFLNSAGVAGLLGLILQFSTRQKGEFRFRRREAFLLVSTAWVTASVIGALPYVFIKGPAFIVDAFFESASGFTTTGASILTDIEAEPAALLLWRSMTNWLGGMGIIVLGIAILPKLAVGGMELLGAEAPGPIKEKLTPRITQTAKALWGIYALLTALQMVIMTWLGMTPLDAVNHAFTTMATGGFSTSNISIEAYSGALQMVIVLFMMLAGSSFVLHFHLLRGKPRPMLSDPEFRVYLGILFSFGLFLAIDLYASGQQKSMLDALRLGIFQSTSLVTTTGFSTANFDSWPTFSRALLFLAMFVGGCAGSTGGSVKVSRHIIVFKKLKNDLKRLAQPFAVIPVRLGKQAVPDDIVSSVTTFLILFIALFTVGGLAMALLGLDLVSAFSASAACIGNIGPGFGDVGATQNYSSLPVMGKFILVALMIVGRLELYTIMVLLFLKRRR